MRSLVRRPARIALSLTLLLALVPAATATVSASDASAIAAAEQDAFDLTNARRTSKGLVMLRPDARLFALARERAEYMAQTDTFSHTQSGGTDVFDLLSAEGITWYGAGEIIAWNTASALDYSAAFAVKAWMDSPGHRAIILSTGYNYVGFGLAISPSTGKRYWAGVYLKGPDRTGAWAKVTSVSKTTVDATSAKVTVKWTGSDTKLQVLTSGFRRYQTQRTINGGAWLDYGTTTATSWTKTYSRGETYVVRVRAQDKAGNWGKWFYVTIIP
jgi:uncharacterized protein YkwD